MRFATLIWLSLFLPIAACAQEQVEIEKFAQDVPIEIAKEVKTKPQPETIGITRIYDIHLNCKGSLGDPEAFKACRDYEDQLNKLHPKPITCTGVAQQGGAVLCQTTPNAKVKVARSEKDFYFENADQNGQIIIGFDRDETKNFVEFAGVRINFDLKPRDYDTSRIDGLPPSQVSTFTEAQLKRIRSSSARKKVGFSSRAKEMGFKNGFISPIKEFRKTTNLARSVSLMVSQKNRITGLIWPRLSVRPFMRPLMGLSVLLMMICILRERWFCSITGRA